MEDIEQAFRNFWGLAFTVIGGAAGCLALPPAFSNPWRVVIFLGLLMCYAMGFSEGDRWRKHKLDAAREEDAKLVSGLETANRQLVERARAAESRVAELELEAARLDAELESLLSEAESEDARRSKVFGTLNARELWCLAHVRATEPRRFSVKLENVCLSSLDTLVSVGILLSDDVAVDGVDGRSYTVSPDWREWVDAHASELPDPSGTMPGSDRVWS